MKEQRFQKGEFAAWIGIVGNFFLALLKGIVGWFSGSKALIADALNSATDVAGSVAVLIGLKAAKLPPDEDHPYGHGKAESIAAIVVSMLLIIVGVELGIHAIKTMYSGVDQAPRWWAIVAIVFSIIVKEALFQYKYRLGKKLSSQALIANAWDHRSDVYASIAALIGVGGALLGKAWGAPWMYYLDPAAGAVVSIFVIFMGYRLIMESIHNTMDHVLHAEDAAEIRTAAEQVSGVLEVDDLRAREHGHYVIVDLKISVNPRITVLEGHDVAKRVKEHLLSRFDHVSDVFIHVNPYDSVYPYGNPSEKGRDQYPTILH